jgi:hypothetical protein
LVVFHRWRGWWLVPKLNDVQSGIRVQVNIIPVRSDITTRSICLPKTVDYEARCNIRQRHRLRTRIGPPEVKTNVCIDVFSLLDTIAHCCRTLTCLYMGSSQYGRWSCTDKIWGVQNYQGRQIENWRVYVAGNFQLIGTNPVIAFTIVDRRSRAFRLRCTDICHSLSPCLNTGFSLNR